MGLSLSIRSGRLLFSVCKALFQAFLFSAPVEELTGKALSLSLSSWSLLGGPYPSLLMQKPQLYVPLQIKASKTLIYSEKE